MKQIILSLFVLLLFGCTSGYTKDGTTVVSYCLLGGVYIDDSKVDHKLDHAFNKKVGSCETTE